MLKEQTIVEILEKMFILSDLNNIKKNVLKNRY